MRIDTDLVFSKIESLIHDPSNVSAKMSQVIDACEAGYPHHGWRVLRDLPYQDEVSGLRSWIPQVLSKEAPPFEVRGVWIGIGNYVFGDRETSDMHFIGSATYDIHDSDQNWAVYAKYRPQCGDARSAVLDSIYDIAYRRYPDLKNEAEWSLCLAYAAFAVAEILRTETPSYFGSHHEVGIVVGFDEGDSVTIGSVSDSGLLPAA
jgi:hypothetical protein